MPVAMEPRPSRAMTLTTARRDLLSSLLSATADALRQTGYGQLRDLDLSSDGDVIVLSGRVPTYFLKQLAQVAAMGVPGVQCVINEMQVVGEETRRGDG